MSVGVTDVNRPPIAVLFTELKPIVGRSKGNVSLEENVKALPEIKSADAVGHGRPIHNPILAISVGVALSVERFV